MDRESPDKGLLDRPINAAGRILLLQFRSLGDAVIGTGVVEAIGRIDQPPQIHVLTRPENAWIYQNNPFVHHVHTSAFPIRKVGNFGILGALHLLVMIVKLRLRGFDLAINFFGDFRENLVGWLISPGGNTSLVWDSENPFSNQLRTGLTHLVKNKINVAADAPSMYAAIERLVWQLGSSVSARPRLYDSHDRSYVHRGGEAIGLHLGAAQLCRLWPNEKWKSLAEKLRLHGHEVVIFGQPHERPMLEELFTVNGSQGFEVVTGTLEEFIDCLSRLRAIVCLDSFSSHAAYAVGTPTLIINGANLPDIWRPPGVVVVEGGDSLACYPCFNRPTCESGASPYACIRDIEVDRVMDELVSLFQASNLSAH